MCLLLIIDVFRQFLTLLNMIVTLHWTHVDVAVTSFVCLLNYTVVWSFMMYSETCLNKTSLEPTYVFRIVRSLVYTGSFHKDFLLWDSFNIWLIEDSGLFRVRFRFIQYSGLFRVWFIQYSGLFRVWFIQYSGLFRVWFIQYFGLFRVWFIQYFGLFRV